MSEQTCWYALTVKHQHERPLGLCLQQKGFETLAPMYRTVRRWSDRTKKIELPLFPGYLFCRFDLTERLRVLDTPGVSRIVGFGGQPAAVAEQEIQGIQAALSSKLPLRPWPRLAPGARVRIEQGPLRGVEGTLIKEKGVLRMVIGVDLLQRSIAVELAADAVVPLTRAAAAG